MIVSRNQQFDYAAGYAMMLTTRQRHPGHWFLTNERGGWELVGDIQHPAEPLTVEDAQAAYDGANKDYQKAWRADEKLRVKYANVTARLLAAPLGEIPEIVTRFVATRGFLQEVEMRTKILLDLREAAFKALVMARGE